ncbi:MAG: hypothetical protein PUB57_03495 [Selenomonadaceae bacterium]|nr:hypothetical protein [Selenomonadaceae bacterium]
MLLADAFLGRKEYQEKYIKQYQAYLRYYSDFDYARLREQYAYYTAREKKVQYDFAQTGSMIALILSAIALVTGSISKDSSGTISMILVLLVIMLICNYIYNDFAGCQEIMDNSLRASAIKEIMGEVEQARNISFRTAEHTFGCVRNRWSTIYLKKASRIFKYMFIAVVVATALDCDLGEILNKIIVYKMNTFIGCILIMLWFLSAIFSRCRLIDVVFVIARGRLYRKLKKLK